MAHLMEGQQIEDWAILAHSSFPCGGEVRCSTSGGSPQPMRRCQCLLWRSAPLALRTQQVAGWVSGSCCSCRVLVGESAALTSRYLIPSTADITHACSCPDFSSSIVVPAWLLLGSSDRNDDSRGLCVARNDAAILMPDETVAASPRRGAAPCRFWPLIDDESFWESTLTPSRSCD
jgi:hypothetical protein